MVVTQTGEAIKAAEAVIGCTGCRHDETDGCLGAPGSLTCASRVSITGDSLDFHKMEFTDCTLYHNSSALFAVTLFLATSVVVYVVYFVRRTTSQRGRVVTRVTPVAWVDGQGGKSCDDCEVALHDPDSPASLVDSKSDTNAPVPREQASV